MAILANRTLWLVVLVVLGVGLAVVMLLGTGVDEAEAKKQKAVQLARDAEKLDGKDSTEFLGKTGFAQKLQSTARYSGLFRI